MLRKSNSGKPSRANAPRRVLRSNRIGVALLLLACAAVVLVYFPGLRGPFVFDDHINIHNKPAVSGFTLTAEGVSRVLRSDRPLAYLSLALNHYASGVADTLSYKVTNLAIHLLNTGLVYGLSLLLLRLLGRERDASSFLPAIVAAVWALHPLQLTSVLYVVQRMTSLSALCVLAGLIVFVYGRQLERARERRGAGLMWLGILGGAALGFGFKENAVLIVLYAAVIEFVFFAEEWRKNASRRRLFFIYGIPAALLGPAALLWLVTHPASFTTAYALIEFSFVERLLTEARVLWFYVSLIVFPASDRFALFHDDIAVSTGLFTPWTTIAAVLALGATLALAVLARRRLPALSFAVLWFLAGHAMESSFIALELVHEHRNYLPSLGPILGIAVGLSQALRNAQPVIARAVWLLLPVSLGASTYVLAGQWGQERTLVEFLLRQHPTSAKTHVMAADWYLHEHEQPLPALSHYIRAAELGTQETTYLIRAVYVASLTELSVRATSATVRLKGLPENDWTLVRDGPGLRIRPTPRTIERIARQLESQPIHDRTTTALTEVVLCIEQQSASCRYLLEPAIAWHEKAAANARSNDLIRARLLTQLVRLHLERRDFRNALAATQRAQVLSPASAALATMEANVMLLAGDTTGAERILDRLAAKPDSLSADDRAAINELRGMIAQRRKSDTGRSGRAP